MIEVDVPQSPGWWLDKLIKTLADRRSRYDMLDSYYRGEQTMPWFTGSEQRAAFREFQRKSRTNFAELIVEAPRERMMPVGFRTGATSDQGGDDEAWRIWQANGLDADSPMIFRSALSMSMAYVMVGGVQPDTGAPLITSEDARQVITYPDPANRRRQLVGLKVWSDDLEVGDLAYLYLPGFVYRARRTARGTGELFDPSGWEWDSVDRVPGNVVPIVPFPNRSDLMGRTLGEFEDVIDILDRINLTVLQRLVISALQAHRQRAVKGVPDTDAAGDPIDYSDIFTADPGAMWLLPAGAELWESAQVDLTPLLSGARHDIQDLAAITRTPLFYLTPDAANGSAEGASLAREGLVFKTNDRLAQFGEDLEQVMALAFLFAGDEVRARRGDMEVIWAPPERFSLAERFDAASKAHAAGVPWRTVMSDVLQYSPQQVARMEGERATEVLLAPEPLMPA